ncbi:hypothetical protein COCNU_13G008240 [Cocos nucifera]|uniref:Uncharacterized protein n=1 Tax=Cocos nucifera TaxID=13894 RepID=A0A8K0NBJ2_COCNU|nr:hypothetical protein COCNU_13G008240 [Cocos nucifera]
MGYAQFSIQGVVGAYSIHLSIGCSGTSTSSIYSTDDIYSIDGIYFTSSASSSRIFCSPTHMAHVWNCQHQKRYDFLDHERARDVRLKRIGELYQGYKVKLHKEWLEHRRDTPKELIPWI